MKNQDSFFNLNNTVNKVTNEDKEQVLDYMAPIKAFSRATYSSIYVIDYLKKGFEFVSDNPLFLCGNTSEEVLQMGYAFYYKHVPQADLDLLLKINTAGFDFYERLPIDERVLYHISYDFHLISADGRLILINHKLTPIFLTNEGKIWKALCFVSLSSEKSPGNIKISKSSENKIYEYDIDNNYWKCNEKIVLSKREKEILHYSTRGYTINEIADAIFVTSDTVKFHRRKLFDKLQVANISEAITFVKNNKLI